MVNSAKSWRLSIKRSAVHFKILIMWCSLYATNVVNWAVMWNSCILKYGIHNNMKQGNAWWAKYLSTSTLLVKSLSCSWKVSLKVFNDNTTFRSSFQTTHRYGDLMYPCDPELFAYLKPCLLHSWHFSRILCIYISFPM